MQTDFSREGAGARGRPEEHPDTRLVLLGDYIDRGRFSFDGVLRTVMHLFVTVPNSRRISCAATTSTTSSTKAGSSRRCGPPKACMGLQGVASDAYFSEYMQLFEALPTSLAFDRFFFVHARHPARRHARGEVEGPVVAQRSRSALPDDVERSERDRGRARRAAGEGRALRVRLAPVQELHRAHRLRRDGSRPRAHRRGLPHTTIPAARSTRSSRRAARRTPTCRSRATTAR